MDFLKNKDRKRLLSKSNSHLLYAKAAVKKIGWRVYGRSIDWSLPVERVCAGVVCRSMSSISLVYSSLILRPLLL